MLVTPVLSVTPILINNDNNIINHNKKHSSVEFTEMLINVF